MMNSYSMTQLARSVANAMGIEAPASSGPSISSVDRLVGDKLPNKAERVLIYNPDCIGHWFWQKYTEMFLPVEKYTQLAVPVATVMPSWTPVCFGTMYTGALPAVHGIQGYFKPVIKTDSLFDAAVRAGKKVALVAVANSSMEKIFAEREIGYYIMPYDTEATEKGLELLQEDKYDLVVVYNQEYDDMIHTHTPEAPESMAAASHHVADFDRLASTAERVWKEKGRDGLIVWASDHGCHVDWEGHGNHGEFREEDINVMHFYGVVSGK